MKPREPQNGADDVFDLTGTELPIPAEWRSAGIYTMDEPARCPHCREPIRSIKVLRLVRSQAPFISTLPRGGRVLVCPACEGILSAELSGLI
jgi:hypothetical protein